MCRYSCPALARQVLDGWQFSGIGVVQSGSPITVQDFNAGAVYGNFENRAQRSGAPVSTRGSLYSRAISGYLTQNAFTIAPEAPYGSGPGDTDSGNSSVGFVRGPGQHNVDMAVERIFPVTESSSFRFRTEFANLNDTVGFTEGPSGPIDVNPAFGQITTTIANPRIVQCAAKFQL